MNIRPVGPGLASWVALLPFLTEARDAVMELQAPSKPTQLGSVAQADLPPAADWVGCIIYVSDLQKVAVSNGTSWTDTTGGAL